jgi:hypothetical protein
MFSTNTPLTHQRQTVLDIIESFGGTIAFGTSIHKHTEDVLNKTGTSSEVLIATSCVICYALGKHTGTFTMYEGVDGNTSYSFGLDGIRGSDFSNVRDAFVEYLTVVNKYCN